MGAPAELADLMAAESPRSPRYTVVGLVLAAAVVATAAVLAARLVPRSSPAAPLERLTAVLSANFPSGQPQVSTGTDAGTVTITLKVPFDPTAEVRQAQATFERATALAEAQNLPGVTSLEVVLAGLSLDGKPTLASRTVGYLPRPQPTTGGAE